MPGQKTLGATAVVRRREITSLKDTFQKHDKDGSREIFFNEFLSTLEPADVERAESMFSVLDRNDDNKISFEEYVYFHFPRCTRAEREELIQWVYSSGEVEVPQAPKLTEEQVEEMKNIFLLYDVNGDGTIDISELQEALTASGYDEDEVTDLFNENDRDQNGTINFDEFNTMMQNL
eukprot:371442-Prorocentrum_minimum.AAC.6